MIDREKEIEKIARVICDNGAVDCFCPEEERAACAAYNKARDILNELIPEGAVVLTREELDKLHIFDDEMFERILDNEREMGRKEMAKETYKRLCNVEYSIYDDAYGYAGALLSEFEKIFNEHGMVVE